jgi:hypothetical protein
MMNIIQSSIVRSKERHLFHKLLELYLLCTKQILIYVALDLQQEDSYKLDKIQIMTVMEG